MFTDMRLHYENFKAAAGSPRENCNPSPPKKKRLAFRIFHNKVCVRIHDMSMNVTDINGKVIQCTAGFSMKWVALILIQVLNYSEFSHWPYALKKYCFISFYTT